MNNLEDLKEKIVFESKNIIETLSKITSAEELLGKKDLVEELNERLSFLKVLEKNEEYFVFENANSSTHKAEQIVEIEETFGYSSDDNEMEEEVLFTNELNEFNPDEVEEKEVEVEDLFVEEKDEIQLSENAGEENPEEVVFINEDLKEIFEEQEDYLASEEEKPVEVSLNLEEIIENEKLDTHQFDNQIIEEKKSLIEEVGEEKEFANETLTEDTQTEVGFSFELADKSTDVESTDDASDNLTEDQQREIQEKKFKLASIKGLKPVESLFDEETLEATKIASNTPVSTATIPISTPEPSLVKSNVSTSYMEAEKSKTEFRLDLNDKLAFTKMLFGGSQSELNDTVRILNSFKNLDEAKEYLSELYYQRHWNKAEEYAQRLWSLVENKFL